MAGHPVFMIRRENLKYIHCDPDPPQLYDLSGDPGERVNRATDADYASAAADFAAKVAARWDIAKLRAQMIATQKQRRSTSK